MFSPPCNGQALVSDGEFVLSDGKATFVALNIGSFKCRKGFWGSWVNAPIFAKAWKYIINEGSYSKHDWVLKVDLDAVLRPLVLRDKLLRHQALGQWKTDLDSASFSAGIYFRTWRDDWKVIGPCEVASRKAIDAMGMHQGMCGALATNSAEDKWFADCMDAVGAFEIEDKTIVAHQSRPERCELEQGYVAVHPYKNVDAWRSCEKGIPTKNTDDHR